MKLIFSPSTTPSFNLAAEEFLFSDNVEGVAFLYVNEPCVIIGSNQAVVNEVDMDFCIENDIRIIRRLSGGGAVYHDSGNLNYCFIHPKTDAPLSTDFLIPVVHALTTLSIPAEIGKRKDIWLDGFKISGTASHVSKNRELHHGTLLYDADVENLHRALSPEKRDLIRKATASVPSPVKNIRAFLNEKNGNAPYKETFFDLFTRQLLSFYDVNQIETFSDADVEKINELQNEKYTRREWNYRM